MQFVSLSVCAIFLVYNIATVSSTPYSCNRNSSCGCSTSETSVTSRIVGGETAPDHAWGWAVSFRRDGSHICGASLLSDTVAITAAHCVDGYTSVPWRFSILAGTNYRLATSSGQLRTVSKITKHPSFNSNTNDYDVALLEFPALESSSDIAYVCLPQANVDPFRTNDNLVAVGWGVLAFKGENVPNALRQVTIQAVASNAQECVNGKISNTKVQFCAGVSGGGKDTCQGDSGGPLMAFLDNQWVLAGLTSSGVECALNGYAGIYTRVSYFVPYIESIVDSAYVVATTSGATGSISTSTLAPNQAIITRQSILATIVTWALFLIFH